MEGLNSSELNNYYLHLEKGPALAATAAIESESCQQAQPWLRWSLGAVPSLAAMLEPGSFCGPRHEGDIAQELPAGLAVAMVEPRTFSKPSRSGGGTQELF